MKVTQTSVLVDDQEKALKFYTEVLGFVKKGDLRPMNLPWLTVVSPEGPDDMELVLEPNGNPAAKAYQVAMFEGGISFATFAVEDVQKEYERMKGLGVAFRGVPAKTGPKITAVLDDTCGNLVKIFQPNFIRIIRRFEAPAERVFDA
jgi:catechol 2,3-dioxygenase-like lactoylglutathione lyase family enzyme